MVQEQAASHGSQWAAIRSIAEKLGCHPETLRNWMRRAEVDTGQRPGVTTAEQTRLKELERENRELRRANEILKKASVGSTDECNMLYWIPSSEEVRWNGLGVIVGLRARSASSSGPGGRLGSRSATSVERCVGLLAPSSRFCASKAALPGCHVGGPLGH
jgi:transposase-like protein